MTGFAAFVAALLVAYNNLLNLVTAFRRLYVPVNLAAAAALLAAGRVQGLRWRELGVGRAEVAAGLRLALPVAVAVALGLATAQAVPRLRPWLADQRVAGTSRTRLAYDTLVRIPLGTIVLEEVAFRGVLFAALARTSVPAAVAGSSIAFGFWHITPTLALLRANRVDTSPASRLAGIAAAVVVTTIGGALLCLLRIASSGLVAPAIAHTATNTFGTLAAYRVVHAPPRSAATHR